MPLCLCPSVPCFCCLCAFVPEFMILNYFENRLYLSIARSALMPSLQVIFFPSW